MTILLVVVGWKQSTSEVSTNPLWPNIVLWGIAAVAATTLYRGFSLQAIWGKCRFLFLAATLSSCIACIFPIIGVYRVGNTSISTNILYGLPLLYNVAIFYIVIFKRAYSYIFDTPSPSILQSGLTTKTNSAWAATKKTIKLVVTVTAFLCLLVSAGLWTLLDIAFPPHDTDKAMIQNFLKNQEAFEEIVAKVQKDGDITRVGDNWYKLTDKKSRTDNPKRIVQYRELLKGISVDNGISVSYLPDGNAKVTFLSHCVGMATGGSCKGYAYEPKLRDAMMLVDDTDEYVANTNIRGYWWVYRKIKGVENWYIYQDYDD